MAKIFSWQITSTKYVYITGTEIGDTDPFIGGELNETEYENLLINLDDINYERNFQIVCDLCANYGIDPTKGGTYTASSYKSTSPSFSQEFMIVAMGQQGPEGKQGLQGPPGKDATEAIQPIPYIPVTMYRSTTNKDEVPSAPDKDVEVKIEFTWDANANTYNISDKSGKWYRTDSDANINDGDNSNKSIIWASSAVYNDRGLVGTWSTPIRITGEDGEPGTDGKNIEFIYKLTDFPLLGDNAKGPYDDSKNEDNYTPSGWSDKASGVTVDYKWEYFCQRRKKEDGTWGNWSSPVAIWSKYGDDGRDGDGVEYCYFVTKKCTPQVVRIPVDSPEYQQSEYYPEVRIKDGENEDGEYITPSENGGKWYDNPQSVTPEKRLQWVIIRKKKVKDGETKGTWCDWEEPALWSTYGEKGDTIEGLNVLSLTKYQLNDVDTPPDVEYKRVDPGSLWTHTIPKRGEDDGDKAIWAIDAYVILKTNEETGKKEQKLCCYDGDTEYLKDENGNPILDNEGKYQYPSWSEPYIYEGRNGRDTPHMREEIFRCYERDYDVKNSTASEDNPNNFMPEEDRERNKDYTIPLNGEWSAYPIGLSEEKPVCYIWYRYRITDNWWGEWSEWQGPEPYTSLGPEGIQGEPGTDGIDGKGVEFVYLCDGWSEENVPGFYVPSDEQTWPSKNPGVTDWFYDDDYCPLTGPDTGMRWHDEPQGVGPENPCEWVLTRTKEEYIEEETKEDGSIIEHKYMRWGNFVGPTLFAKWGFNGKDGDEIEYIYCLTNEYSAPRVEDYDNESPEAQEPDFCPGVVVPAEGDFYTTNVGKWMDNALSVDKNWPYQWEVIRKKTGTEVPEKRGTYKYTWSKYMSEDVHLHSKWGRDGDRGRPGIAGVAGIHYEMRYIAGREDEEGNVYLYVPTVAADGHFATNSSKQEIKYKTNDDKETDAWNTYFYEKRVYTKDEIGKETYTTISESRHLDKELFPLYTTNLLSQDYPYIYFIQSRIAECREVINEDTGDYNIYEVLEDGTWSAPARMTGTAGVQGPEGKRGPILYSAGVYGKDTTYTTTPDKHPYVWDSGAQEYFYLKKGNHDNGDGTSYWYVTGNSGDGDSYFDTPGADNEEYGDRHWVKMEQFDVILSNVGIFRSALVGSGVFWGKWFYSQTGLRNGVTYSKYEEFIEKCYIVNNNGTNEVKYKNGNNVERDYDSAFFPTMALNLYDGSGWFANGNIMWDSGGTISCKFTGKGSFGEQDSNGKFPFRWDDKSVYFDRQVVFGNPNGVSGLGGSSGDSSGDNPDANGVDKDELARLLGYSDYNDMYEFASVSGRTIIKNGIINTNLIDTDVLISDDGFIGNLFVKKLNTTGYKDKQGIITGGTISIEGDKMSVYNTESDNLREVLCITGNELSSNPVSGKTDGNVNYTQLYAYGGSTTVIDVFDNVTSTSRSASKSSITKLGNFTVKDDGIYYIDVEKNSKSNMKFYISRTKKDETTSNLDVKYSGKYIILPSDKVPTKIAFHQVNATNNKIFQNETDTSWSGSTTYPIYEFEGKGINGKTLIKHGEYTIYFLSYITIDTQTNPSTQRDWKNLYVNSTDVNLAPGVQTPVFKWIPNINRCDISSYGFRYIVDTDKFVQFDKNGTFKMKNGNSTLYLDDKGMFMGFNGETPRLISPMLEKFRIATNGTLKRKNIEVLTVGTEYNEENE